MMLGEMQSRGLIKLRPDEDNKPRNEAKPQAMWSIEEDVYL